MTTSGKAFPLPAELQAGAPEFQYHILDTAGKYQQQTGGWPQSITFHPDRGVTDSIIDIVVIQPRPAIAPLVGNNDASSVGRDEATRRVTVKQDPNIDANTVILSGTQQ